MEIKQYCLPRPVLGYHDQSTYPAGLQPKDMSENGLQPPDANVMCSVRRPSARLLMSTVAASISLQDMSQTMGSQSRHQNFPYCRGAGKPLWNVMLDRCSMNIASCGTQRNKFVGHYQEIAQLDPAPEYLGQLVTAKIVARNISAVC